MEKKMYHPSRKVYYTRAGLAYTAIFLFVRGFMINVPDSSKPWAVIGIYLFWMFASFITDMYTLKRK